MKENSLISSMTTVLSIATWTASRLQESKTDSFLDGHKVYLIDSKDSKAKVVYLRITEL